MNATNKRYFPFSFRRLIHRVPSATIFLSMIFCALIFFELFNYSTTQYALNDLLGELNFLFLPWATILALAFCVIDFAGIARLLSPHPAKTETRETWFMFGAWLLAATMNATLTWWGVAIAMSNHALNSLQVMDPLILMRVVPIFVAVMVWVIRILIIGAISYAVARIMGKGTAQTVPAVSINHSTTSGNMHPQVQKVPAGFHPIPAAPTSKPVYSPISLGSMPSPTDPSPRVQSTLRM
jgi:hypothetical protein